MSTHFVEGRVVFTVWLEFTPPLPTPPPIMTPPGEVELAVCDTLARWAAMVRDKTRDKILSNGSIAPR